MSNSEVKNYKIEPAFTDDRGDILDILDAPVKHIGMVTFNKKGVRRGDHYHKESIQYTYVTSGEIRFIFYPANDPESKEEVILKEGDFSITPPGIVHTHISITPAKMMFMTTKSRKDDGYEEDTVRVSKV